MKRNCRIHIFRDYNCSGGIKTPKISARNHCLSGRFRIVLEFSFLDFNLNEWSCSSKQQEKENFEEFQFRQKTWVPHFVAMF